MCQAQAWRLSVDNRFVRVELASECLLATHSELRKNEEPPSAGKSSRMKQERRQEAWEIVPTVFVRTPKSDKQTKRNSWKMVKQSKRACHWGRLQADTIWVSTGAAQRQWETERLFILILILILTVTSTWVMSWHKCRRCLPFLCPCSQWARCCVSSTLLKEQLKHQHACFFVFSNRVMLVNAFNCR